MSFIMGRNKIKAYPQKVKSSVKSALWYRYYKHNSSIVRITQSKGENRSPLRLQVFLPLWNDRADIRHSQWLAGNVQRRIFIRSDVIYSRTRMTVHIFRYIRISAG